MASSQEAPQDNNPFIMPESGTLIAWLFNLDKNMTRAMGGVLSERGNDLSGLHSVLDLACGSGGWILEVASQNPEIGAIGLDLNGSLMDYVKAHAKVRGLDNADFRVMDILKPMDFPDESFDLINARTLFSSLAPADWPPLLQECKRLLRPGGVLRLTELERFITNSPAFEKFWDILARALYNAGRSFSVDGKNVGIVAHLGRLLHEAGFQDIQNKAYTPEMSAWSPDFEAWRQHTDITWTLLEPFYLGSGLITQEELAELRNQANAEMLSEEFCGIAFIFTAWGSKP